MVEGTSPKEGTQQHQQHAMQEERSKLRKVLKRFDLICFTLVAIVAVDGISSLTKYGRGEIFFWLFVVAVLYFVPSGLIAAELGTSFPVEGGPYAWPRVAFGRLYGTFTAVFYWMSNPLWIGGSLAAAVVATLGSGLMLDRPNGIGTVWSIIIGLGVVWGIIGFSIVELQWGKLTGDIGAFVRAATLAVFLVLVAWFLIKNGRPAGTITWSDLKPSLAGFLAVFGLLQFFYVGFELSNSASEEMRDPRRDVPAMIARAGIYTMLLNYGLVLGVLLVIPLAKISNVSGFVNAYSAVNVVLGGAKGPVGWIMGVLIILVSVTTGGVWIQGSARCVAVAGLDGAAPLTLGKFSKAGTPIAMNIVSGIIGSVFVILVFTLTSGSLGSAFAVMFSLAISLTAFPYLLMFPSIIALRRKYPDIRRPYKIPGGAVGMWACVVSTMFVLIVTVISLLWPGLIDNTLGRKYDIVGNWGVSRLFFESVTLGTFGAIIVIALVFAWVGKRNVARSVVGDNDLLATERMAPPMPSGGAEPEPVATL
jgi:amino acid transporter